MYDKNIINGELSKLSLWLKLNKLSINVNKSKCMVFRQPQRTVTIPELTIDENIIEVVDNFSFIGLNNNKNLKWENHIDCISNKISRTIGIMKRIRHVIPFDILENALYYTNITSYKLLHFSMVIPVR